METYLIRWVAGVVELLKSDLLKIDMTLERQSYRLYIVEQDAILDGGKL